MTQQDLETLFWRATMVCLGLDPDSQDQSVLKQVRISWPLSDIGNTNWGRDENVVFLRISPNLDRYGDLHDIEYSYDDKKDEYTEIVSYHRGHSVMWVCYGPNACDYADRIRIGIQRSAIHDLLMQYNVAIQPSMRQPVRMPEQDLSGEWWERCDLTCDCYELDQREYAADYTDEVPDISIST